MTKTKIDWADRVWNPITGCTKVSEGCQNCYAEKMTNRLQAMGLEKYKAGFDQVVCHPETLGEPLKWKKPQRVFVCSMSDLFHENVPGEFILKVLETIYKAPHLTFMVLTKRPERALELCHNWGVVPDEVPPSGESLPKNLWIGVTAENQKQTDKRIPILLQIPAAVRFVSVEPMLGPVDIKKHLSCRAPISYRILSRYYGSQGFDPSGTQSEITNMSGLDWVICGGESASNARPLPPGWVRFLRDQCKLAGVPFFFKQWGAWYPNRQLLSEAVSYYAKSKTFNGETFIRSSNSGNLLDGVEYRQWPEVKP